MLPANLNHAMCVVPPNNLPSNDPFRDRAAERGRRTSGCGGRGGR
jgi:hypothetical protein